jgi:hypothetical protein
LTIHTTGFAEHTSAKPKPANCYFLSPGERIKGEGESKTQSSFCRFWEISLTRHLTPALSPNFVGGEGESFAVHLKIRTTKFAFFAPFGG